MPSFGSGPKQPTLAFILSQVFAAPLFEPGPNNPHDKNLALDEPESF